MYQCIMRSRSFRADKYSDTATYNARYMCAFDWRALLRTIFSPDVHSNDSSAQHANSEVS